MKNKGTQFFMFLLPLLILFILSVISFIASSMLKDNTLYWIGVIFMLTGLFGYGEKTEKWFYDENNSKD